MAVFKKYKENKPTYKVPAFDGGKNTKWGADQIDDRESPDLQNVSFDDVGAVGTRLGSAKLNTDAVGSFNCNGLFTVPFSARQVFPLSWMQILR